MATFEWAQTAEHMDAVDREYGQTTLGQGVAAEHALAAAVRIGDLTSSADIRSGRVQHVLYPEDNWALDAQLDDYGKASEYASTEAVRGLSGIPPVLGRAVMQLIEQR